MGGAGSGELPMAGMQMFSTASISMLSAQRPNPGLRTAWVTRLATNALGRTCSCSLCCKQTNQLEL